MTIPRLLSASLLALACTLTPAAAQAQVDVHVDLRLPGVPSLVVVQPGVEVVEGYGDEVFFHGGAWWMRRGPVWYRSPTADGRYVVVRERSVPPVLSRLPPGRYRNYRAEKHEHRREWHEDKKAAKQAEKEDRREEKEHH
jgi:hypothetical protein